jgi:hypothetical protein
VAGQRTPAGPTHWTGRCITSMALPRRSR